MPNILAYIVLLAWPLVVIWFFRRMSIPQALACSIVGGYLLIAERAAFNLPVIPTIDKTLVPSLTALIMCWVMQRRSSPPAYGMTRSLHSDGMRRQSNAGVMLKGLVLLMLISPIFTVWQNGEPVIAGPRYLGGLTAYDAFSIVARFGVVLIPFMLAFRFLSSEENHLTLMKVLAVSGAAYAVLALFEIRMSPQLNSWIYGYFPHSWRQHLRGDGFRPVVFLNHGLWLGIFFTISALASFGVWRHEATSNTQRKSLWLGAGVFIAITLALSKSFGALMIFIALAPIVILCGPKMQLRIAALIALAIVTYPLLRGMDLVPTEALVSAIQKYEPERAASLEFRFDQEDRLLVRAQEKALFGWGSGARNRVWDDVTGEGSTIPDGMWILVVGSYGWAGYISQIGLLTLPVIALWMTARGSPISVATAGLTLMSAASMVDLIPNATLTPITWIVAGAIAGYYARRVKTSDSGNSVQANPRIVRLRAN